MNRLIYVCSPYGGREENYRSALVYGRYVISQGALPVIPHTMLHGILNDASPKDRASGLELGSQLMKMCSEIWVFGKRGNETAGMSVEIAEAENIGKPVRYICGALSPNSLTAAISRIARRYEELTGGFNRMLIEDAEHFILDGLSPDLIIATIELAVRKEIRCPWNYARRICERCLAQHILTLEQFNNKTNKQREEPRKAAYDTEAFERMLESED